MNWVLKLIEWFAIFVFVTMDLFMVTVTVIVFMDKGISLFTSVFLAIISLIFIADSVLSIKEIRADARCGIEE